MSKVFGLNDCPIPHCGGAPESPDTYSEGHVQCSRCGFAGPSEDWTGELWNDLGPPDGRIPSMVSRVWVADLCRPNSKKEVTRLFAMEHEAEKWAEEQCRDTWPTWITYSRPVYGAVVPAPPAEVFHDHEGEVLVFADKKSYIDFCEMEPLRWTRVQVHGAYEKSKCKSCNDTGWISEPDGGGECYCKIGKALEECHERNKTLHDENSKLKERLKDLEYDETRCEECIYHPNSEKKCWPDQPYKTPKLLKQAYDQFIRLGVSSNIWVMNICQVFEPLFLYLKARDEEWHSWLLRFDGWEEADQKRLERLEALEARVNKIATRKDG